MQDIENPQQLLINIERFLKVGETARFICQLNIIELGQLIKSIHAHNEHCLQIICAIIKREGF